MALHLGGVDIDTLNIDGFEFKEAYLNGIKVLSTSMIMQVGGLNAEIFSSSEVGVNGHIYVCGFSMDRNGNIAPIVAGATELGIVIKFSPKGEVIWQRYIYFGNALGFTSTDTRLFGITCIPDGNGGDEISVAGYAHANFNPLRSAIVKLNNDGNFISFYRNSGTALTRYENAVRLDNGEAYILGRAGTELGLVQRITLGSGAYVNAGRLSTVESVQAGCPKALYPLGTPLYVVSGHRPYNNRLVAWFGISSAAVPFSTSLASGTIIYGLPGGDRDQFSRGVFFGDDYVIVGHNDATGSADRLAYLTKCTVATTGVPTYVNTLVISREGSSIDIFGVYIDDSHNIYTVMGVTGVGTVIMKLDSTGAVIYQKRLHTSSTWDCRVHDGKLYITGTASSENGTTMPNGVGTLFVINLAMNDPIPDGIIAGQARFNIQDADLVVSEITTPYLINAGTGNSLSNIHTSVTLPNLESVVDPSSQYLY